jgi:hypothetical protein
VRGTISTQHLLTHAFLIVHEFGLACFVYCLWLTLTVHRRPVTFLECVAASGGPSLARAPAEGTGPRRRRSLARIAA